MADTKAIKHTEAFGEIVKKRRLQSMAHFAGDGAVSKSKSRKMAKNKDKLFKRPAIAWEQECGVLYNNLLSLSKRKENFTAVIEQAIDFLAKDGNPCNKLPDNDTAAIGFAANLNKPIVSRLLQVCLKLGDVAIIQKISMWVESCFLHLIVNPSGFHLVSKLLRANAKNKELMQSFETLLLSEPQLFFTKFGAKIFDLVQSFRGSSKVLRRFVLEIFFRNMFESEINDYETNSIEENLKRCSPILINTIRNRISEFIDKLVLKELVCSDVSVKFLQIVFRQDGLLNDADKSKFSEAMFDASVAMLSRIETVEVLMHLVGYWSAKLRKRFVQNLCVATALNRLSLNDYINNKVDSFFFVRFIRTLDDTKFAFKSLIKPLFEDFENKASHELAKVLISVLDDKRCAELFNDYQVKLIHLPFVSSVKNHEVRRRELAAYIHSVLQPIINKDDIFKELETLCINIIHTTDIQNNVCQ